MKCFRDEYRKRVAYVRRRRSRLLHILGWPETFCRVMWKLAIPVMLVLIVMSYSCRKTEEKGAASGLLPVAVARPEVRNVTLTKDYPGYLSADATIDIMGRVNGTLQCVNYTAGQRVKKGQLLFVIEPSQYKDAVEQAEAALKTAQASLEYARSNYERMKEAIKSDAVSQIQLLQAETNVKECEAQVSNAEATLSSARTTLGYCYVKAPCDGQMNIAVYSAGAYIGGAGAAVKLATIYKDDRMYSYFNISDNQWLAQSISKELTKRTPQLDYSVTVALANSDTLKWKAKLDYLSPNVTLNTGTLEVRAELQNPDGQLKAGSYISVTLPYGKYDRAVLVPDVSIGTDQLGKYLYVVNDSDIVCYRPIKTGQLIGDTLRLVTSGLKPNERFVTKALLKVRDGMKVDPVMQK